jgi:hypothetical protein
MQNKTAATAPLKGSVDQALAEQLYQALLAFDRQQLDRLAASCDPLLYAAGKENLGA